MGRRPAGTLDTPLARARSGAPLQWAWGSVGSQKRGVNTKAPCALCPPSRARYTPETRCSKRKGGGKKLVVEE